MVDPLVGYLVVMKADELAVTSVDLLVAVLVERLDEKTVFAKVVMLVVAKVFLRVASKAVNWAVQMVWMLADVLVALSVDVMVERMDA